ncbi:MAG: hypothetical protein KC496_23100 [Anaerolineae bacterium]|nr:hypothetical protein [Anaerolineae bacterium]
MDKHGNMMLAQALGAALGATGGYLSAEEDENALLRAALFATGGALVPKVTPEIAKHIGELLPESVMIDKAKSALTMLGKAAPYVAPLAAPLALGMASEGVRQVGKSAVRSIFGD